MKLFKATGVRTPAFRFSISAFLAIVWSVSGAVPQAREDKVTRVLWRDPGPIAAKNLQWGTGSPEGAPKAPFTFVAEDRSGTKPKVDVTDANGTTWRAKFLLSKSHTGSEVHAEIAASRLMWALGYPVEENYYVAEGRIEGVTGLRRDAARVIGPDGSFKAARFEKRPADVVRIGRWDPEANPFLGSRELSGLKIMTMLLNNWDFRKGNSAILRVPAGRGGSEELYIVSDLGTAFGRMGSSIAKSTRWNLEHYRADGFIKGVTGGKLEFQQRLLYVKHTEVPVNHARWFAGLISQLSHDQVRQAFQASGASPSDVEGFSAQVMARIKELRTAVSNKE